MRLPFAALLLLLPAVVTAEDFPSLGPHSRIAEAAPVVSGRASFYSTSFHGRRTASGETYEHHVISAASNRFPMGTLVAVRRVPSARCVVVRINDRMGHRKRVIDLSREAAVALGMIDAGVVDVEVTPLPKYLVGHERACMLAFQPPAHLQAVDGAGLRAPGK
ncbi:MAG: septal ring lytic transglycosylase RlpA family protein [Accumulibacter sp.]|uniref:septal ring lytic transglycosylase RlpA family protein n=1 Tax=Accumulibacter sp. TaxID=2053492 RepID=UPI002FC38CD6